VILAKGANRRSRPHIPRAVFNLDEVIARYAVFAYYYIGNDWRTILARNVEFKETISYQN
jgi:hypothetical protein